MSDISAPVASVLPPPLVSVLICTFNAEHFIAATLDSVSRQTYDHIEILVVDNASLDGTHEKLQLIASTSRFAMRIFRSDVNLGASGGLNLLLDRAQGNYVAILDHDDFWHEDKTRLQVEFLETHPEFPGCGGQTYVWWEATGAVSLWKIPEQGSLTFHSTLMFRNRPDWRYDPHLHYRADAHFTQDVLCDEGRRLYNFQRPLLVWRMRADGNNLSRRWNSVKALWLYWQQTRQTVEALKGLAARVFPRGLYDHLLRTRHSVAECRSGDAVLQGFPPPVGPPVTRSDSRTHGL